jgi:dimethylamine monooxygenase subunit C
MKVHFERGKRKYIFITAKDGIPILKPIIDQVKEEKVPIEMLFVNKRIEHEIIATDIEQCLRQQKMGTYLYVALPWARLRSMNVLIEKIGYSSEEAQYIGYGPRKINVFCCRCHGITETNEDHGEIECMQCHLELSISDHYSSLRDAYLGYVATL